MKKIYFLFFLICISIKIDAQIIDINNAADPESELSLEQLVTDVLIGGSACAGVDTFSEQVSGSPTDTQTKSYGFFKTPAGSRFPFEEGIVLTTGSAFPAGNTLNGNLVDINNGLPGDADLAAAIGQANTNDATFIKFNFIPTISDFKFNFIMASEEYDGATECNFADGFAFLLREVGAANYTNLAVLPDGVTPISVLNINNAPGCTANTEFFEGYGIPDTNYGGRTVELTAEATVIPNQVYEIKLVVADVNDSAWDSAIFLEAGSFNIGLNLGQDLTVDAMTSVCNDTLELNTGLTGEVHKWSFNGVEIMGETGASINVSQDGTYSVEVDFSGGCTASDTIEVEFTPAPTAHPVIDQMECDDNNDGFWAFDLSALDADVLNGQAAADYMITYHTSEADADTGDNALASPYTNAVAYTQEAIWVRIENNLNTNCYSKTDFLIEVVDQPLANVVPDQLVCDDNNDGFWAFDLAGLDGDVLGGQDAMDFSVTYHTIEQDAIDGINELASPYTNQVAYTQETIWVRIENNGNATCFDTSSFTINVFRVPDANTVPDQLICDADNDGFWAFDLAGLEGGVLGGQAAADYAVSFHTSEAEADNNDNPLASPYTNQVAYTQEVIWVRIENNLNTSCFSTTSFVIDVFDTAMATSVEYALCDDDVDGDDTNGIVEFDLSSIEGQILGLQSGMQFTVSYYLNQTDADAGTPALPLLYTNTTANAQQIVARVDNVDNADCYATTVVDLVVNPLPVITSLVELRQCDDDTNDGFVDFNLTEANELISANFAQETFSYYLLLADAESGMNAIADPTVYTNTDPSAAPDVLYFRVETTEGCYRTGQLNLVVSTTQIPAGFELVYEVCDDDLVDGDELNGVAAFDFSNATAQFEALFPAGQSLTITYYENLTDALAEENAIVDISNHRNAVAPFVQNIVVRIDSDVDNGCLGLGEHIRLVVHPLPVVPTIDPLIECGVNGVFDFDLTQKDTEAINGQGNVVASYYGQESDAESGMNALASPYTNTTNPETVWVRLDNTVTGCYQVGSFELMVNEVPTIIAPTDLIVCDDETPDGLVAIDLSVKNTEISGGDTNYSVTYYEIQADADAEINTLSIPYTNTSNPQTIFVRLEDITTGCYATTTLDLIVEQAPAANIPTPLEYCDPDSDGIGEFILTDADAEIIGAQVGLTVSYHGTMADAENDVVPLSSPYTNDTAFTDMVYARVESAIITTDCATVVPLQLIVHNTPAIDEDLTPLEVCDDDANGLAQFDLTQRNDDVLNGLDAVQYQVSYYSTEANAEVPTNAIVNTTTYTNVMPNTETLWVRVDDTATGCFNITTLELIVNVLPVLQQPTPLELCDYTAPLGDGFEPFTLEDASAEILNGQTGISLTFYEQQSDADAETNPISSPYTNTSNPQTIYVRAENDITGCYSTITLDLLVNPLPTPVMPDPLEVCDADNDGFEAFDLESRTAEIINGELNVVVSYHESQSNAETNTTPLVSPYTNIMVNSQTVYVRVENTVTSCFNTTELELIVQPSPEVPLDIDPYTLCDDNNDGLVQFDLTTKDDDILGTQLPADFSLTYHEQESDAQTGSNAIANTTNYTNISNPQTIWVRLVSNTNSCVTVGQFDLVVDLPPVPVQPTPLEVCDDELPGEVADEMVAFDLTVKDGEITGGNASWLVSYYETDADAQSDMNVIDPATSYVNTSVNGNPSNPQTLYVRVTDTDTGCFAFTTLTIRVLPIPTPNIDPEDLELCDDLNTGDQTEVFDLTVNEAYIIDNEPGVTASYYETLAAAEAGMPEIADPTMYSNTETPQTIYVRITNGDDAQGTNGTGCYAIVTFDLIVNELPNVTGLDVDDDLKLIACEFDGDDIETFDLTQNTAVLLDFITQNGQDAMNYQVTYHEQLVDAQAAMNAIGTPTTYDNTSNPQTIFVNITDTTTGCDLATVSFEIEVQDGALAEDPLMEYVICDNIGAIDDGLAQFNLTGTANGDGFDYIGDLYGEILAGQDPANFTITFYETQLGAEGGLVDDQIPFTYENISNPQTIYIRVDNDTLIDDGMGNMVDSSVCYAISEMVLRVNPLPVFDIEDAYLLCVSTNGSEVVVTPPTIDTGLSAPDYSFEWVDGSGAVVGTGSTYTPSQGGTYTVTVTNTVTGCESMDSTRVDESSPASITATVVTAAFAGEHAIEVVATTQSTTNDISTYEVSVNGGPWQEMEGGPGTFTLTVTEGVVIGDNEISVRDINGCGESEITITVIDYPLYFTPNGDGIHETWNIAGIASQANAKIYIFDRFGKLLKQISPTSQGWNGTYKGELMPNDDYWFTIEYTEPLTGNRKEFKAHFTLKR